MAKTAEKTSTDVQSFLKRMNEGAKKEVPAPAITGIAVRKDGNAIHVATSSGIVAVPAEAIVHITNPIPARLDVVTLHVREVGSIRPVFPVRDLRLPDVLGGRFNPAEAGTTNTTTSEATETYTADPVAGYNVDDCRCVTVADDSCD